MSPRKNNLITVEAWPKLRPGRVYKGRVKDASIEKKSNVLHVVIENLNPRQFGRIHEIDLPLPVRPGNHTCSFLLACGIEATAVGATVCLDQIANTMVAMRFRGPGADGTDEFDFEKVSDSTSIETDGSHQNPAKQADSEPSAEDPTTTARTKSQTW